MNDPLDRTVRDALDAAGSRAVAPPFAAVRRRHALRRRRRATGAALSAVTLVAVGIATPSVLRRGAEVTPAAPLPTSEAPSATPEPEPTETVEPEPPVEPTTEPDPRSGDPCYSENVDYDPDRPFATENIPDFSVRFYAGEGLGGVRCTLWGGHPPLSIVGSHHIYAHGRVGSLRPALDSGTTVDTADSATEHVVVWGALQREVVRVRFTTGTKSYDYTPVRLPDAPDRVHVGYVFPRAVGAAWSWRAYDAEGRVVARS